MINRFEDLVAWQKARLLSKSIYTMTRLKSFFDDPDLKRPIRRASGSVMDNIAEGFGRSGRSEFIQFLGIAKGSVTEVKSQLYRSIDNEYIVQADFDTFYEQADEVSRIIDGLISYLNKSDVKGLRYKK